MCEPTVERGLRENLVFGEGFVAEYGLISAGDNRICSIAVRNWSRGAAREASNRVARVLRQNPLSLPASESDCAVRE